MEVPQKPQGATPPAAPELPAHEWDAQMDTGYGGEAQPTGGDDGEPKPKKSQASSPSGNPLVRWLKNLARGPADAVNAAAQTMTELSVGIHNSPTVSRALASDPLGYGRVLSGVAEGISATVDHDPEKAKQAKDRIVSEPQIEAVYGPKPQDFIGSLLHGTSQFITGALPAGPLGLPAAGAFSMGTAFDPYQSTVADFVTAHEKTLNKVPVAGRVVYNAANILKVEPDDSPVEARIKKTIEGEVLGRLTGFILRPVLKTMAGGLSRAKALATGNADAAARAEAELARARAPEPTDVVTTRPTADGHVEVVPVQELRKPLNLNGGRPTTGANSFQDAVDKFFGNGPGEDRVLKDATGNPLVRVAMTSKGGDVVELKTIESLVSGDRSGNPTKVMQELTRLADEHGVTLTLQASPFGERALSREALRDFYRKFGFEQTKAGDANMVRRPGDAITDFRETTPGVATVYSDAAAAESDAATVNAAAYEVNRGTTMFTPDEVKLHQQTAEALKTGDVGSLETNPHFNLQSIGASEDVNAQIGALTKEYSDLFSVAQGRPSVPNEVLHANASRWASEVHLDNFLPAMAKADAAGRVELSLKAALYNAAVKQAGQEVAEIGQLMAAKPGDNALEFLARRRLETFLRVSEATANFNSELGRGLQALSARNALSAEAIRFGSEVTPRASIMQPASEAAAKPVVLDQPALPFDPQGMSPQQLGSILRLFQRSGGDVRVVPFVMDAMRKEWQNNAAEWAAKGAVGKAEQRLVTTFINGIISGYKTAATIATSGATMNAFQATAKVLGGAGTLNRGLAEEGAAQWYSLFRYSKENMRGAWAAFKENRSIIDGTPPFHVDPNPVMKAIAVPGRVAGSLDEFTRTAAYRADEFSTAFRQARDEGLSLSDAVKRAELDVSNSVDQATGIGLNPAALKRAGVPTLSDHLGNDSFIGKMSNVLAEYPLTKFAVPFVRPSVNTFRYAWANAPILNQFSREAQATLLRGGEEATTLHARTAMTGSMMLYAMGKFMDGEITGAGPKDPQLYAEWSKNHQPYSVKVDGVWHSFRRAEPFATFLGSVADGMELYNEVPDEDRDELGEKVQSAMTAVLAAGARNITSKSWTESLLNFFSALDDKDQPALTRYLRGIGAGLVPYSAAIRQFNTDPSWREVRELMDGVRAQTPGWSETLPARFDWSGEKRARQGSLWNRNFAISPEMDASPSVEDTLVDNYIRLAPPNPRPYKGIDMWDKKWARADGKVPYEVFMEKLAATGIRKQIEELVQSDVFQQAPQGTSSYPESLRGDLVSQRVGAATEIARNQMLQEFGDFALAYNAARYVVPSIAKFQGKEAADSLKDLYGIGTDSVTHRVAAGSDSASNLYGIPSGSR